jgi:hypothetical protein
VGSSRSVSRHSDPEILAAIELAFDDAWTVLTKRDPLAHFTNSSDLRARVNRRLVILASDGVTDTDQLTREVLANFPSA